MSARDFYVDEGQRLTWPFSEKIEKAGRRIGRVGGKAEREENEREEEVRM